MQAIQVKYLIATTKRLSRVKAFGFSDDQVVINFDFKIDVSKNYEKAARELLKKLNLKGVWLGGQLPGSDYAFVCVNTRGDLTVSVHV
jgi:hypothetical protein